MTLPKPAKNEVLPQGENNGALPHASYLSAQETREILTPFAFEIDKSLFGVALASPWKRGVALLVDLLLIALLSETPGELLALVVAITVFRLGSKKRAQQQGKIKGAKRRAMMRLLGAFIVFVVLASNLPELLKNLENEVSSSDSDQGGVSIDTKSLSFEQTLTLSVITAKVYKSMSNSACESVSCWEEKLALDLEDFHQLSVSDHVVKEAFTGIAEVTDLTKTNQELLSEKLFARYLANKEPLQSQKLTIQPPLNLSENDGAVNNKLAAITAEEAEKHDAGKDIKSEAPVYSLMQLAQGIVNDLGLGFGWAAFYFTIFTSLWQGQTPGKKLMSIKVLQLDGTPLSLSDSFGRYGGYGAGIATGLLGFLQIYWDPNRQAIHDKISATVVIDLKKNS